MIDQQPEFVKLMEQHDLVKAAALAFKQRNFHRQEAAQWDLRWKEALREMAPRKV